MPEKYYEIFGNNKGDVRTTMEARRIISEFASKLGSYDEANVFLRKNNSLEISSSSIIRVTKKVCKKTENAWINGTLAEEKQVLPKKKIPKIAKYVGLTLVIGVDGTCAPCVHSDTKGIKGKNTEEAKT